MKGLLGRYCKVQFQAAYNQATKKMYAELEAFREREHSGNLERGLF